MAGIGVLAASGLADDPSAKDITRRLNAPLPKYRLAGPLETALPAFAEQSKLTIEADWHALQAAGVVKDRRVVLVGVRQSPREILNLLAAQLMQPNRPLGWYQSDDRVILTTKARADAELPVMDAPPPRPRTETTTRPRDDANATGDVKPERLRDPNGPAAKAERLAKQRKGYDFDFRNTPLSEALDTCRRRSGANVYVNWGALGAEGITRDAPVSFEVRGVSVARALDLVLTDVNGRRGLLDSAYWVVDDGVVTVSSGRQLNTIMRTTTLDVGPLLQTTPSGARIRIATYQSYIAGLEPVVAPNAAGYRPIIGQLPSGVELRTGPIESDRELRDKAIRQEQSLLQIVRDSCPRELWEPIGEGSVRIFKKQLVVTQSLLGYKLMERAGS